MKKRSGGVNFRGNTKVKGSVAGRDIYNQKIVIEGGLVPRLAVISLVVVAVAAILGMVLNSLILKGTTPLAPPEISAQITGSSTQPTHTSAPADSGTPLPSNPPPMAVHATSMATTVASEKVSASCPTQWTKSDRACLDKASNEWDLITPDKPDRICTETLSLAEPILADGIHITMTQRANSAWGYSLYEVEIYGPDSPQTNLVKETSAQASSAEKLDDSFAYTSTFAIDGKLFLSDTGGNISRASRWASDQRQEDPQWLSITLPVATKINRIVLKWEPAYAKNYCVTIMRDE